MPVAEKLKEFYYGLVDKAWVAAEGLEKRGIPLASFCEKNHINPLLVFILIILAVVALIIFLFAAFGGAPPGTLTVTAYGDRNLPLDGAAVSYYVNENLIDDNITDNKGKASLKVPIGADGEIRASKSGYKPGSQSFKLEEETDSATITLARRVGSLEVLVDLESGMQLPSSAYVEISGEGIGTTTAKVVGSKATFKDLPVGVSVMTYVVIGDQRIPGSSVTIVEDKTVTASITVTPNSLRADVQFRVRDSVGQNVDGAAVTLMNWNTDTQIGSGATLGGVATINDVTLGTSAYVTVDPNDPRLGRYNGKQAGSKIDITEDGLSFDITLTMIGGVEVCVYTDGSPATQGRVRLLGTDGANYGEQYIVSECVEFYGIPEGESVYPEVNVQGYPTTTGQPQTVDYSGVTRFRVELLALSPSQSAQIFIQVTDCDGGDLNAIRVKVIDAQSFAILHTDRTSRSGSATYTGELGRGVYAVAFDEDYVLGKSGEETIAPNTVLDIMICEADDENSGNLEVCVYKDGEEFEGAKVNLYRSDGVLLWDADTDSDEDDKDHCHTFMNIEAGMEVYTEATNLGTRPVSGDMVTIGAGSTQNSTLYSGSPPVILDDGDVEVCVYDYETNRSLVANVTLVDIVTDRMVVVGTTGSNGCKRFEDLVAEVNNDGVKERREIYAIVAKRNYARYNGREDALEMIPSGLLKANVFLEEAFPICVQVRDILDDSPKEARVVLYYNSTGRAPIEVKSTNSDGFARFNQSERDEYYFKIIEDLTLYEPLEIYELSKENVTGSNCGVLYLYDLGTLCKLGLTILEYEDTFRVPVGSKLEVPIRLLWDGDRVDLTISDEGVIGTEQRVVMAGDDANITLRLGSAYTPFSLRFGSTPYSSREEPIVTVNKITEDGTFNGIIEATVNEMCSRQAHFTLDAYAELLEVTSDALSLDKTTETSKSFCIYVEDQDGGTVKDATVTASFSSMDGWKQDYTKTATWNAMKKCYVGSLSATVAPDTSGTYPYSVMAVKGLIEQLAQFDAEITVSDESYCGDGTCDSNEDEENCSADCGVTPTAKPTISAGTATLSIGAGTATGFCVYLHEQDGTEITDGEVTATFGGDLGWPKETKITAGYDSARSCYYVAISDSIAMKTTSTTTTTSSYGSLYGYGYGYGYPNTQRTMDEGTYSVYVTGKTSDGRTATTTTTVIVECGCDKEKWYEPTCICDPDWNDLAAMGDLNFFNCLVLSAQKGYTPYPANYMGSSTTTGSGLTAGGFAASGSAITLPTGGGGFLGFDWEACKKIFKDIGWDKGIGEGDSNRYVLVNDHNDVVIGGTCTTLINMLKGKGAQVIFVENSADNCCYGSAAKKGNNCDPSAFSRVYETGLQDKETTQIDIKVISSDDSLRSYPNSGLKVYRADGNGNVLYDERKQELFGKGVAFSVQVGLSSGDKANTKFLWGALEENTLRNGFSVPAGTLSTNTAFDMGGRTIKYVDNSLAATTIVFGGDQASLLASKLENCPYFRDSSRSSDVTTKLDRLASGTRLVLIGNYEDLKNYNNLGTYFDKYTNTPACPGFVGSGDEKISVCDRNTPGEPKQLKDKLPGAVLLRYGDNFLMGIDDRNWDQICKLADTKLNFEASYQDTSKLGYICRPSEKVWLVASVSDSYEKEMANKATKDWMEGAKAIKVGSYNLSSEIIKNDKHGVVIGCKTEKEGATDTGSHGCIIAQEKREENLNKLKKGLDEKDQAKLLDCICVGAGVEQKATLEVTVDKLTNNGFTCADVKAEIKFKTYDSKGELVDKPAVSMKMSEKSRKCSATFSNIPLTDAPVEVKAMWIKDGRCLNWTETKEHKLVAEGPNTIDLSPLARTAKGGCASIDEKPKPNMEIKGTVLLSGTAVSYARVQYRIPSKGGYTQFMDVDNKDGKTDSKGEFIVSNVEIANFAPVEVIVCSPDKSKAAKVTKMATFQSGRTAKLEAINLDKKLSDVEECKGILGSAMCEISGTVKKKDGQVGLGSDYTINVDVDTDTSNRIEEKRLSSTPSFTFGKKSYALNLDSLYLYVKKDSEKVKLQPGPNVPGLNDYYVDLMAYATGGTTSSPDELKDKWAQRLVKCNEGEKITVDLVADVSGTPGPGLTTPGAGIICSNLGIRSDLVGDTFEQTFTFYADCYDKSSGEAKPLTASPRVQIYLGNTPKETIEDCTLLHQDLSTKVACISKQYTIQSKTEVKALMVDTDYSATINAIPKQKTTSTGSVTSAAVEKKYLRVYEGVECGAYANGVCVDRWGTTLSSSSSLQRKYEVKPDSSGGYKIDSKLVCVEYHYSVGDSQQHSFETKLVTPAAKGGTPSKTLTSSKSTSSLGFAGCMDYDSFEGNLKLNIVGDYKLTFIIDGSEETIVIDSV
jgi:hypothetical protein